MAASTEPDAVQGADLVLFCVKSTDTEAAAAQIAPHLAPGALVLTLQNGVDNDERARSVLPRHEVAAAVVYVATGMAGPGHVKHNGRGELVIAPSAPRASRWRGAARGRRADARSPATCAARCGPSWCSTAPTTRCRRSRSCRYGVLVRNEGVADVHARCGGRMPRGRAGRAASTIRATSVPRWRASRDHARAVLLDRAGPSRAASAARSTTSTASCCGAAGATGRAGAGEPGCCGRWCKLLEASRRRPEAGPSSRHRLAHRHELLGRRGVDAHRAVEHRHQSDIPIELQRRLPVKLNVRKYGRTVRCAVTPWLKALRAAQRPIR